MKSVPHLFADLTAALEDMHGIAVEGQQTGLSWDEQAALVRSVRSARTDMSKIVSRLGRVLR